MPLIGNISGSGGIGITGSVVFGGADPDHSVSFPTLGNDVAFYVSGSSGGKDHASDQGVSVFGGDLVVSGALAVGNSRGGKPTSTALNVYGNVESDYIVKFDNDQNTAGHVLKLITDGNGSASRFLEMEDGDGDTLFRARADGRFGFGATGVSSMGAGTFVVGIDGGHTSDIAISKRLQHLGDSDTYMDFTTTDQIEFVAGGVDMIHMTEDGTQDKIVFNEGGADVDFRVESSNKTHAIFVDGSTDQVLILSGGAAASTNEAVGTDINFYVSGTVGSRTTSIKGTSVFGGDMLVSGTIYDGSGNAVTAGGHWSDGGSILYPADSVSESVGIGATGNTATEYDIYLSSDGAAVFNEQGASVDFRVESANEDQAIWLNGSNNKLHFNKGKSAFTTTIWNNNDNALEANSSGITLNEEGDAANDFRVETSGKTHAIFVDAGTNQVLILSGGGASSPAGYGTDTNFFVSGTVGTIGTGNKGTSVFGGDMLVSGGMVVGFAPTEAADGSDTDFTIHTKNKTGTFVVHGDDDLVQVGAYDAQGQSLEADGRASFQVSGNLDGFNNSAGLSVFGGAMLVSGAMVVGFAPGESSDGNTTDFTVHTKESQGLLTVHGNDGQVQIGSYGQDGQALEVDGRAIFQVSGNLDGINNGSGLTVFGGAMLVSGAMVVGFEPTESGDGNTTDFTVHSKDKSGLLVVHGEDNAVQIGAYDNEGQSLELDGRTSFQVSGNLDGFNNNEGLAVFGGAMLVSGAMVVGFAPTQATDGNETNFIVHSKERSSRLKVDGENGRVVLGADDAQGNEISVGSDTFFYVSGGINHKNSEEQNSVAVIGGDLVVSGVLYGGVDDDTGAPLFEINSDLIILSTEDGAQNVEPGQDVTFFVSGTLDGPGSSDNAISVFGGDMVISGGIYGGVSADTGAPLLSLTSELLVVSDLDGFNNYQGSGGDVGLFVSGSEGGKGEGDGFVSVFGGDVVVSGTFYMGDKTAVTHDADSSLTQNTRSGHITLTTNGAIAGNNYGSEFTISSNKVLESDVIMCTSNEQGCYPMASDIADGSFKVKLFNWTGGTLADDTVMFLNWTAL